MAAVLGTGFALGALGGHLFEAAIFALALALAWSAAGFPAVFAVCAAMIALGSSSIDALKDAGGSVRWIALMTLAAWPAVSKCRLRGSTDRWLLAAGMALSVFALVSVAWSVKPGVSLARAFAFALMMWVALVVVPAHARRRPERVAMARAFGALCGVGAAVAIALTIAAPSVALPVGPEFIPLNAQAAVPSHGALWGWLEAPNTMGLWCALLLPAALALRSRTLALTVVAAATVVVAWSYCRSALVVLLGFCIVCLPLSAARRMLVAAAVVAGLVALWFSPAQGVVRETALVKFSSGGGIAQVLTGTRHEAWTAVLDMSQSRPVAGFGFGTGDRLFRLEEVRRDFVTFAGGNAHNTYLNTLLELGAIGLILLAVAIGTAFRAAWDRRRERGTATFVLMAGGFLVAGFAESLFTSPGGPFSLFFWAALGLAAAPVTIGAGPRPLQPPVASPKGSPAGSGELLVRS